MSKDHTKHPNSVKLDNRELWFDGSISIKPDDLLDMLAMGVDASKIWVTHTTTDIEQYNRFAQHKITVKSGLTSVETRWNIPTDFLNLDIKRYIMDEVLPEELTPTLTDEEITTRIQRVISELELYKQHNAYGILRVLIYIVNTLTENDVIWGVGRGSSVASYVLYLIGVHDIDSVKYKLDITDFLR